MKRLFDILFSFVLIIFLSPLFLFLIGIIIIFQGKPIFFIQERPGFNSKIFKIIKFRTMIEDVNDNNDISRITKIGKFLRETSLDELPELINILKGEMSFVGPRPLLPEYLPLYSKEQDKRHKVKPGITGWAQVNGRNALSWKEKFALEGYYVEHQSIFLDLKILIKTIGKVLLLQDVNAGKALTMEPFNGEN